MPGPRSSPSSSHAVCLFAIIISAALASSPRRALAGPPSNDACSDAREVELGAHAFSNIDATAAPPGMCALIGRDVWFKFTSTFTGSLLVSTCDDADFDTVIAVYDGCACGSLDQLGCNDEHNSCDDHTSRLVVPVVAGRCYLIRVAGFSGDSGNGVLTLTCATDECAACASRIRTGVDPNDRFGFAVSGGGRMNGDSFDDVVVGGYLNDTLGLNTGRAYAFRGETLNPLYTFTGSSAGDNFGYSVLSGCDVNDDGRADIIIGAPFNDDNGPNAGRVYAYSGFNGTLLWSRAGAAAGDRFGYSLACAGDVNADGFDDVLVGAPFHDTGGTSAGRAYVLRGQNGAIIRSHRGQAAGDVAGWAVAGIGDLNTDGKDDYAVGMPRNDAAGANAGRVFVFSGANGQVLQRIDGDAAGDRFGSALAGSRFTSGAAYSFLIVGAPFNDAGGSNAGRARVYYRNHSNPGEGGCNKPLCVRYTMNGGNAGDRFGSAVAVGDLVGTSVHDIIIGAPNANFAGNDSGAAYIFNGASGALAQRFFGEAAGDKFGTSLALAGDVNDDGRNDLIAGSPFNDVGGTSAGRAYVFFLDGAGGVKSKSGGSGSLIALPPPMLGDLNADHAIDAADLLALIGQWGPCDIDSACTGDINGDGTVDSADLVLLLTYWGG